MNLSDLPSAWMLRRDGAAFPCIQHFYGSRKVVEETLYAAQWLYCHTQNQDTKQLILHLLAAYGNARNPRCGILQSLHLEIVRRPYLFLTHGFIEKIGPLLPDPKGIPSMQSLNQKVLLCLNEEFLRTRLGGLYYTVPGCRDLYFRISSLTFDWSETVTHFLQEHRDRIDTISVLQDEESLDSSCFYRDPSGKEYRQRPWRGEKILLLSPEDTPTYR